MSPDQASIAIDLSREADFAVGAMRVRPSLREVLAQGQSESLEPRVMQVLVALARQRGEVVSRDRLVDLCWDGRVVGEDAVSRCIGRVRKLAETHGFTVETIPRVGYRLTEPTPADTAPPATVSNTTNTDKVTSRVVNESVSLPWWRRRVFVTAGVLTIVIAALTAFIVMRGPARSVTESVQTLAILPFKPLVPSERNESLELGMAESLIANLGKRGDRTIRPLSSVRRYAALDQDAIAAGRALGVDAVLDGLIQRQEGRLRVSVRMVRVVDGLQLWSQQFDQNFTGIFAVQDAIATRIAQAMPSQKVSAGQGPRPYTQNSEAYALYASGRLAWTRYSEPSLLQAIDFFKRAIVLDPNYALAYAGLADCYAIMGVFGMRSPHEVFPLARDAIDKALSIDSQLAAAHSTLGHIKVQYEHDWDGGAREYARAIELDPDFAPTYHYRGILYAMSGAVDRGLAELQRAQQLEPYWLAPRAAVGNLMIGQRRYDEAIAHLRETLTLDDRAQNARGFLVRALIAKGDYKQALLELPAQGLQVPSGHSLYGQTLALSGRHAEATAELNRVLTLSKQQFVQALDIAIIYAALGDADNAFQWIERAVQDRSTQLGFIAVEPAFTALHADPRFAAVVKRIGIYGRKLPE